MAAARTLLPAPLASGLDWASAVGMKKPHAKRHAGGVHGIDRSNRMTQPEYPRYAWAAQSRGVGHGIVFPDATFFEPVAAPERTSMQRGRFLKAA